MGYYDFPPIADILILFWALGMVYAISKYRFLSITPTVAADKIISTMTDFLILLDLQGNIVSVNRAALNLLAHDENDLKGHPVSDIFVDSDSGKGIVKKLIDGAMHTDCETQIKTKEGQELPVSLTTSLLEGSGFVCIARDITLQKRSKTAIQKAMDELDMKVQERTEELRVANKELTEEIEQRGTVEKQLRDSEALFKALFEYAPDGYYMSDLMGTFIDGNKEAERITGYKKEELIGKSFLKLNLLPVSQIPRAAKFLAMNSMNKPTGPDEFTINRKDGTQVSVEISTYPLTVQDKQLVLGIARDISQRKISEDEKTHLEEQLRQAQKMEAVGRLAGGIAHDFNNMLGAISGYADMIKTKFAQDNPKLIKYTNGIIGAAKRSADLTAQLLAYARKGKFVTTTVKMHEVVQDVINIVKQTIDKPIEISQQLTSSSPKVMGDHNQLQNALLNIAINALDAMPDGGTLSFTTEIVEIDSEYIKTRPYKIKKGNYLMLSLSDTGIGMDKETAEKAFEPFFTTKEPGKGTGLGLSGAYGTVKGHGGFIELESEPGKGTKVSMFIPHIQRRVRETSDTSRISADGCGNILLVDDEAYIREIVSEALGELGYSVATCKNGKEAVEYYHKHHKNIDLVILDLIMPKMGGYDCLIELKKINPSVRILVSSGYSSSEEAKKVIEKGVVGYVQKPFNLKKFSQTVKDAIAMDNNK
jgi:PAS domain S-box-containing protein